MAVVRICLKPGCRTLLSQYNPTKLCWEHRSHPRRLNEELEGTRIQADDQWLLRMQPQDWDRDVKVETWRPHMMSESFIRGLGRRELSKKEKEAYWSGEWLG